MASEEPENSPQEDASRRTWLAAERTWLAWWRTGLAAAAAALAVGRLIPALAHGAQWPFQVLGIGYGATAIGVAVAGAMRQRRTADGLRRGSFDELPDKLVMAFTAAVVVLALATVALIAVKL